VSDFNAEVDEDNGNAKPAGPVWKIAGSLIGVAVGLTLLWIVIANHHY
jgi:hypothetical protein